jgi:hypothetical protein
LALLVEVRLWILLRRSNPGILHAYPIFAIESLPCDGFRVVGST